MINSIIHNLVDLQSSQAAQLCINWLIYCLNRWLLWLCGRLIVLNNINLHNLVDFQSSQYVLISINYLVYGLTRLLSRAWWRLVVMDKCLLLQIDGQPIISIGPVRHKLCHLWSKNIDYEELGAGYKSWITPNIHNLVDLQSSQAVLLV